MSGVLVKDYHIAYSIARFCETVRRMTYLTMFFVCEAVNHTQILLLKQVTVLYFQYDWSNRAKSREISRHIEKAHHSPDEEYVDPESKEFLVIHQVIYFPGLLFESKFIEL